MIDFVKIWIKNISPEHFINNPLLDFGQTIKVNTGEIVEFPVCAKYGDLDIIIKSESFTEVKGSLHKQFTGGLNWDNFNFENVNDVVVTMCNDLGLMPDNCRIVNLEFGVNVILPFSPEHLLKRLISFKKGESFSVMKTQTGKKIGFKCFQTQYGVKIYDKKYQYKLSENVIRFEVKVTTMEFLNPICKLSDLLQIETFRQLQRRLIEIFDFVLITDQSIQETQLNATEKKIFYKGVNPKFWETLHDTDRKKYFYYLKRFKKLQNKYGTENYHSILRELIVLKSNVLLKNSDVLSNFSFQKFRRFEHSNSISNRLN